GQEAKYLKQIAQALNEKEEANKQKEILAIKLAIQMKKCGVPLDEIAIETGLTKEDIEKL
ncbi:MAG: hypothetical protein WCS03_19315, partial [Bacteroidota bacterium]